MSEVDDKQSQIRTADFVDRLSRLAGEMAQGDAVLVSVRRQDLERYARAYFAAREVHERQNADGPDEDGLYRLTREERRQMFYAMANLGSILSHFDWQVGEHPENRSQDS